MTYLNPSDYNKYYSSKQAKRENKEIARLLNLLNHKGRIIDIGCGTGLGSKLTDNDYLGIDFRRDRIDYAKENERGKYLCIDAIDFLKQFEGREDDLFISLFAIDYMPLEAIDLMKQHNHFIVSYNKPYLKGSGSFYVDNEPFFREKHPNHSKYVEKLQPNAKLLNEEYYYITENKQN